MYGLVDCNNFYVSCERVFNPLLRDKPVVVLSNNDGCIIARSNEAKSLGIPMGAPLHLYRTLIKQNKVLIYSSNYTLYGDMSSRVMNSLNHFVPDMEIYSIDEAFLCLKKFNHKILSGEINIGEDIVLNEVIIGKVVSKVNQYMLCMIHNVYNMISFYFV